MFATADRPKIKLNNESLKLREQLSEGRNRAERQMTERSDESGLFLCSLEKPKNHGAEQMNPFPDCRGGDGIRSVRDFNRCRARHFALCSSLSLNCVLPSVRNC